ncbi:hypothetical protein DERF_000713 [Dermatophagoides farinae]|uniref:Uncharacterized protein n=1 Tax=Dermatophagoides farinae TaxID=6954 RepID=A0A922LAG1_DERFA|nr:hypothetical protein DERF_000713 [Dermatophagoides farinae]
MGSCLGHCSNIKPFSRQKLHTMTTTIITKTPTMMKIEIPKSSCCSVHNNNNNNNITPTTKTKKKPYTSTYINLSELDHTGDDEKSNRLIIDSLITTSKTMKNGRKNRRIIPSSKLSLSSASSLSSEQSSLDRPPIVFKIRPTSRSFSFRKNCKKQPQQQQQQQKCVWIDDLNGNTRQRLKEKQAFIRKLYETVYNNHECKKQQNGDNKELDNNKSEQSDSDSEQSSSSDETLAFKSKISQNKS